MSDDDFAFFKDGFMDMGDERPSGYAASSPTGDPILLLTQEEVKFYEDKAERYQSDYAFTDTSDLLELGRLLMLETLAYRWGQFILHGGFDYNGAQVSNIEKTMREYSKEIRDLKSALGIDKKSRDANQASSLGEYLKELLPRAGEFGIKRNEEMHLMFNTWMDLIGKLTLYKNATEEERIEFKHRDVDIFDWIWEKHREIEKIDEEFLLKQKMWIKDVNPNA